jgi:hypothetical protein
MERSLKPTKWSVYEYMRQVYMRTGTAPTKEEVFEAFEDTLLEAIEEGMMEFHHTVYGRFMQGEGVSDVSADL